MALSTEEWLGKSSSSKKNIGVTQSILAGLGSGIFKIFEGGATLGATLLDLGVLIKIERKLLKNTLTK